MVRNGLASQRENEVQGEKEIGRKGKHIKDSERKE